MNVHVLLQKLIDIERSVPRSDVSLHKKVIEAQECALKIQKEIVESSQHQDMGRFRLHYPSLQMQSVAPIIEIDEPRPIQ